MPHLLNTGSTATEEVVNLILQKRAAMTQPNLFNTSVHRKGRHAVSRDYHEVFVIVGLILLTFRTNSTTQNTITSLHIPRLYA